MLAIKQDIKDDKILDFVVFCITKLSVLLKLPQQDIYTRLENSGILYDYIVPSYDVLHTFSFRYLMEDLTDYMCEKVYLVIDVLRRCGKNMMKLSINRNN